MSRRINNLMDESFKLISVDPPYAIPGGEIAVTCQGFKMAAGSPDGCYIEGFQCRLVAASSTRLLAIVPDEIAGPTSTIRLESMGAVSNELEVTIGRKLVGDMHIVANPAVDPSDGALILTRSGSRGQHLPATLFRLEPDGYLDELPDPILNPTGIAFDREGQMFITNRAQ